MSDDKQTDARISALEARVQALETALHELMEKISAQQQRRAYSSGLGNDDPL